MEPQERVTQLAKSHPARIAPPQFLPEPGGVVLASVNVVLDAVTQLVRGLLTRARHQAHTFAMPEVVDVPLAESRGVPEDSHLPLPRFPPFRPRYCLARLMAAMMPLRSRWPLTIFWCSFESALNNPMYWPWRSQIRLSFGLGGLTDLTTPAACASLIG